MQQKKSIIEDIDFTRNLRGLCQTYEELSVMEMQKIRNKTVATRAFYNGLSTIYCEVKTSYKNYIAGLQKKNGKAAASKMLIFGKNGRTASIFISANTKLYGDIINQTFSHFVSGVKDGKSDLVIVGRQGRDLYESSYLNYPYQYFELSDMKQTFSDLQPILQHAIKYEKINIYYGLFKSLLSQTPEMANVSGDQPFDKTDEIDETAKYLFEPSLKETLTFFELHIVTAMFAQLFFDSRLARLASRIQAMEDSLDRVDAEMKLLNQSKKKLQRLEDNRRQLQQISGLSLWA